MVKPLEASEEFQGGKGISCEYLQVSGGFKGLHGVPGGRGTSGVSMSR